MLGPRQSRKTTLAHQFAETFKGAVRFYDMESVIDSNILFNAELVLKKLTGLVVIDEIQLRPDLFSVLRVLVDRKDNNTIFMILGSASPNILKHASESLAGRIDFINMNGFNLSEVSIEQMTTLWDRGGFPRSFLSQSTISSIRWRENFVRTFMERDLPQLGITISSHAMWRFWTMLAHTHGQVWNASKIATSMSVSDKTMRSYLDILTDTYMVRQLQPWFENIKKREVKSPKIYLRDSGILHHLLSIREQEQLFSHPILGFSWEGFAIETIASLNIFDELFFWSSYSGSELDLLAFYNAKKIGFEFKVTASPKITKSMYSVLELLKIDHLFIVCLTDESYPLTDKITVLPLHEIQHYIESL